MIDPPRLDPARRDAVCAQCHMSGEARVDRAGMRFKDYRPGALLSAANGAKGPGTRVTPTAQTAAAARSR